MPGYGRNHRKNAKKSGENLQIKKNSLHLHPQSRNNGRHDEVLLQTFLKKDLEVSKKGLTFVVLSLRFSGVRQRVAKPIPNKVL